MRDGNPSHRPFTSEEPHPEPAFCFSQQIPVILALPSKDLPPHIAPCSYTPDQILRTLQVVWSPHPSLTDQLRQGGCLGSPFNRSSALATLIEKDLHRSRKI